MSAAPLTDSFTVGPPTARQTVTVTIDGANDAAVIMGTSTGSAVEARRRRQRPPGHVPRRRATSPPTDPEMPRRLFQAVAAGAARRQRLRHLRASRPRACGPTPSTTATRPCRRSTRQRAADRQLHRLSRGRHRAVVTVTDRRRQRRGGDHRHQHRHARSRPAASPTPSPARRPRPVTSCPPTWTTRRTPSRRWPPERPPPMATAPTTVTAAGVGPTPWTTQRRRAGAERRQRAADRQLHRPVQDGTAQPVTVTIDGANDAAVITGTSTGAGRGGRCGERRPGQPTATGDLTDHRRGQPADTFQAVAAGTASTHGYGSYA